MVSSTRRGKRRIAEENARGGREDVLIGTHCKRAAMINARPLVPTKTMVVQTFTRNRLFMNTRNYEQSTGYLSSKFWGTNVEE
jgi:hypothetical protein